MPMFFAFAAVAPDRVRDLPMWVATSVLFFLVVPSVLGSVQSAQPDTSIACSRNGVRRESDMPWAGETEGDEGGLLHLLPRPFKEECSTIPYAKDVWPDERVAVTAAQPVGGWGPCPSSSALVQTPPGLLGHFHGDVEMFTRASNRDCRQFYVPIDYSQGLSGGKLLVTVLRGKRSAGSDQIWGFNGGPGSPSHGYEEWFDISGFTHYAMDFRGTGWSTLMDCPELRRKLEGDLPYGDAWLRWVGLGNVSVDVLDACLQEFADTVAHPKHFTGANGARDLAAVIMALQEETGKGRVGMVGLSYATYWLRHFLHLQGSDFPLLAERFWLDGVVGSDYEFGQYALASNSAGTNLLERHCDAACRKDLGLVAGQSAPEWLRDAVLDIDRLAAGGAGGPCGAFLWEHWVKKASSAGWTSKTSVKEALGAFGYLSVTLWSNNTMVFYPTLVHRLQRCLQEAEGASGEQVPSDFEYVVSSISNFTWMVESYFYTTPAEFSNLLHHIVAFGEMWTGPPELTAWGGPPQRGRCSFEAWRGWFDQEVVWAPDFVSLMLRYQALFDRWGYRATVSDVRSTVSPSEAVAVQISTGDDDGLTPIRSASKLYDELRVCKGYVELSEGGHIVSRRPCVIALSNPFYQSNSTCAAGSTTPEPGTPWGKALADFKTCNGTNKYVRWGPPLDSFPCDGSSGPSPAQCPYCFDTCVTGLTGAGQKKEMAASACAARWEGCAKER